MDLSKFRINKDPKAALSILLQLSLLLVSVSYALLYPPKANAATFVTLRLDRQYASVALAGVACIKPTAASQSDTKVIITFPSTFTLDTTVANWSVDTTATNLPSTTTGDAFTATAWTGISAKPMLVDNSTKAAIFTSTQLTSSSNYYCFHFNGGASSNVGAAGNDEYGYIQTWKSPGVNVENDQYAVSIVSGTNGEQIEIKATVSAAFTFSLSGGAGAGATAAASLPLGIISASTVTTAPYTATATISTNGTNGFLAWIKDGNAALYSNTTGQNIPTVAYNGGSPTTLTNGSNGYGVWAATGTNSPTIATMYNTGQTGTSVGAISDTAFSLIASKTGAYSGETFLFGVRAAPAYTITPATDYTDVLTVVASGSF
ncbi:MAG: hypothetical protein ABSE17_03230 [Candidatus Levyibacteriota bacterium]|jgi:hypothetical protein